jgi:hypothetical protein
MYSAEALCKALQEGLSIDKALSTPQPYELLYIARIPVEIHRASQQLGWHFFTLPRLGRSAGNHLGLREATNDLEKLKQWARSQPRWALATGSLSGVFVMVVDGMTGQNSLIRSCSNNWSWLDTLRTQAGQRRFIFFSWPKGRRQNSGSNYIGEGLYILGEGDWLLMPPARELNGDLHVYIDPQPVAQAEPWLLDLAFEPEVEADPSLLLAARVSGNWQPPVLPEDVIW